MTRKIILAISCLVLLWGCAKKATIKSKPVSVVTQENNIQDSNAQRNIENENEPSIHSAEWQSVPDLKTINYNYDEAILQKDARDILVENAVYLKAHPEFNIIVEGHCDDRGTNEYNMSLGQQRAKVVREYYGKLGIPLSRIATISYGEEKPTDSRSTEDAWAKNRRAETKIKK